MTSAARIRLLSASTLPFLIACTVSSGRICSEPTASSTEAIVNPSADPQIPQVAQSYPEAVLIEIPQGEITYHCSGSVLTPTVVLTAGHCVDGRSFWRVTAPYAGGQQATASSGDTYDYHGYGDQTVASGAHDVGLIFLDTPIDVTSYPAVMPPGNTPMYVVNVGRVDDGHLSAAAMYAGDAVPISPGAGVGYPFDYASDKVIQPGDSGGPAIILNSQPHVISSVASGLTQSNEILARVDLVYPWILSSINAHGGGVVAVQNLGSVGSASQADSTGSLANTAGSQDPCAL